MTVTMTDLGRIIFSCKEFCISDLLSIFEIYSDCTAENCIFILPKANSPAGTTIPETYSGVVELSESRTKGNDYSEISDIRTYRAGNRPKDIHWKLSARQPELMVKERVSLSGIEHILLLDLPDEKNSADKLLTESYQQIKAMLDKHMQIRLLVWNHHLFSFESYSCGDSEELEAAFCEIFHTNLSSHSSGMLRQYMKNCYPQLGKHDTADRLEDAFASGRDGYARGVMKIMNVAAMTAVYLPYYSNDIAALIPPGTESEYTFFPFLDEIPEGSAELSGSPQEIIDDLRDYFQQEHPYTLSPEATPRRKDFVNYFLAEKRKGYCAHYASSAVLVLRYMGIPARYVEGYAVDAAEIAQEESRGSLWDMFTRLFRTDRNAPSVEINVTENNTENIITVLGHSLAPRLVFCLVLLIVAMPVWFLIKRLIRLYHSMIQKESRKNNRNRKNRRCKSINRVSSSGSGDELKNMKNFEEQIIWLAG